MIWLGKKISLATAGHLTERHIVDLCDQFFNVVQAISYGFGLKPLARDPNGLLTFIFRQRCGRTTGVRSKRNVDMQATMEEIFNLPNKKRHGSRLEQAAKTLILLKGRLGLVID